VDALNLLIKDVLTDNLVFFGELPSVGAKFVWKTVAPGIDLSDEGLTASKRSTCSYAIAAANVGWKGGSHCWYIKVTSVSCYDTIGVIDETFFGQTKPIPVGFGTYAGSHRSQDGSGITYGGLTSTLTLQSIVKCTLDLGRNWQFVYQVIAPNLGDEYKISLTDRFTRGTKIYPALVLCNNASYTLIDAPKK